MVTDTSASEGATPATGQPATGTPASNGAMPPKPATSLEEAMARIAELEHATKNATEERDRHRKKLSLYEEAEKRAQEAALSEVDKASKRATEAEARIKQYQQQLVNAQVKLAAKDKGIIDPDIAALALADKLEYGDDGMPTNLEKALDDLIKSKPYLVPKADQAAPASPAQTATPAIPAMNPGRSSIQSPGKLPPGKIPTWEDVYKRR
jgi:uncharacterized membrane protein YccC